MQGANYSLNQGFNYKTFKTAWIETKNGWTTSFWRRCSSSSPLSLWPFSTVKEAERCSSNRRPLASVMGALMVADRWPTVRYQPAEPYINRAAPKNKVFFLGRVIEKETEEGEKKETRNTKTPAAFFWVFLGTPYRKRAFPHQHLPKTTKTEMSRERVGRTW